MTENNNYYDYLDVILPIIEEESYQPTEDELNHFYDDTTTKDN
jgi:hypothetical protein